MSERPAEPIEAILREHQHAGRVNPSEGWVECECGVHLPCEFEGPPHHDPAWDEESAWSSDYQAIVRHQAVMLVAALAAPSPGDPS